jgi:hypothetical protein
MLNYRYMMKSKKTVALIQALKRKMVLYKTF